MSRPTGVESTRRKSVFLQLVAAGVDPVTARKRAGIHPDRALRIVTETDFHKVVEAIRQGFGPVAVTLEPDIEAQAA